MADALVREVEQATSLQMSVRPRIQVYPSVAVFRNATGEPGWIAASTKGRIIRMQPGAANQATMRHEIYHVLIESNARPGLPLWFREGLALSLAGGPLSSDPGYAAVRGDVDSCIARYGKSAVLGWLAKSLPADVKRANPTQQVIIRQ